MKTDLHTINISNYKKFFECVSTDSVLEAGLRNGLALKYRCSNGSCGECYAELKSGSIKNIKNHDFVVPQTLKNMGGFLMCCSAPTSDIKIMTTLIGSTFEIPLQQIPTKLKTIIFKSDNIAILTLKTPRTQNLQFLAGQSVQLTHKDTSSTYPISSCPCFGMEIQFHIKLNSNDDFSKSLFDKSIGKKSLIYIDGPSGIFVLDEFSKLPITIIAYENGFGAVSSIIEHALSIDLKNKINFFWAYNDQQKNPYLHNQAKSWVDNYDNISYTQKPSPQHYLPSSSNSDLINSIFDSLNPKELLESNIYISAPAEILIGLSELIFDLGVEERNLIATPS